MRLFHTTQSAERILAEGFRDALGPFEFVHRTHYGVFVASSPAYVDEDPRERQVLEITLPDHVYLDEYAIIESGRPVTEWCMPAALLNRYAQVRLLDQAEVDALPKIAILSDKWLGAPPPPMRPRPRE
jgi:hypothetical protein